MDFSFKEKSAWGLLLGIAAVSFFYFPAAFRAVDGEPIGSGLIGLSIAGVVALVLIQIIYHGIIAVGSRHELEEDERDRLIDLKAERLGGFALGFGLVWIVARIIATTGIPKLAEPSVLLVAVWLLAALTASEVVKLTAVIFHYRAGA